MTSMRREDLPDFLTRIRHQIDICTAELRSLGELEISLPGENVTQNCVRMLEIIAGEINDYKTSLATSAQSRIS